MASKQHRLRNLGLVTLFNSCTKKELEQVDRAGDQVSMAAGETVITQGEIGREAFVILDGAVTVKRNKRKVATLGAGRMVGELSLLDSGPRTATVTCDTDCTFLVIGQQRFRGVVEEVPAITHKLMVAMAARLRELDRAVYG